MAQREKKKSGNDTREKGLAISGGTFFCGFPYPLVVQARRGGGAQGARQDVAQPQGSHPHRPTATQRYYVDRKPFFI